MAPIFDSGNSMFYKNTGSKKHMTRKQILGLDITGLHKKEEQMLKHVTNKDIFSVTDALSAHSIAEYYESRGISKDVSDHICAAYEIKMDMLREFQRGETISYFLEKQRE